ncbi:MFS general substrate transporter [Dendrothele bispora CBS 962.96]|uniref:MFS general substrate transporter n=1 Tax=Dendrothele bispora (strain CBS 962.96) TaxID=1314807 RepID=A0A4S8MUG0_DENBC|nr:MFS general substrate transporter [Dendrothele bispora CBS 962.96]
MTDEQTRLLPSNDVHDHEANPNANINASYGTTSIDTTTDSETAKPIQAYYDRFSRERKWAIVGIISCCGLLPLFVSGSFFPTIPDIAKDLDTTGSVVSLTVSISVLAACIGALFGATYSGFYGRKPVYLCSLPLLVIGSVGVALSSSVPSLMIWRFIQTTGGAPGLSVGAGVIGDIYRLEERGTAMGVFFSACLLGPALAPFVGGLVTQFFSWRIMQFGLGACGLLILLLVATCFPETSIPGSRGIDKRRFRWINPFKTLLLLRSPNLLAVAISGTAVLIADYVLLVPLAYTVGAKYDIRSQAAIGMCYIPIGLGNLIGSPLAGYISDRIVVAYRAARGGVWYPEDRLRGTLIGAGLFVPVSVIGVGVGATWASGIGGFILCLVSLFLNGIGVDLVLSPMSAYIVDILHSRSAESMAANNAFRSFLMSILIAPILPSIETIGVFWTNLISAVVSLVFGFGFLWIVIRYGERLRAWVDVGFSTSANN